MSVEVGSSPLVSLAVGVDDKYFYFMPVSDHSELIFADSHGKVTSYSLDQGKPNGNFAGPSGSVLSLDVKKTSGEHAVLACVGLDRFLRVFDISSRENVMQIYCKTKMTSVLIIDGSIPASSVSTKRRNISDAAVAVGQEEESDAVVAVAEEEESDAVWAMLPEVADTGGVNPKRRRIRL